jgi:hypothetical protein
MHSGITKLLAILAAAATTTLPAAPAFADDDFFGPHAVRLTSVPTANPKVAGIPVPNVLSPELIETIVAQGSTKLENPSALTSYYGYDNDGPLVPAPGDLPSSTHAIEATKTEPDKNTYLVLHNQTGADPNYDYGTHFIFQGHELGRNGLGYITRINLDADGAHRVTLMATTDANGNPIPTIDGSTWYPFSHHLLFTTESSNASVLQATLDVPSKVEDISGILGRGGYEGIQADLWGRLIIVEDVGGKSGAANPHAKQPNSFVYRFLPNTSSDLKAGGKLQVLQVMSKAHAGPIVFGGSNVDGDIKSQDQKDLHTFGLSFPTNWVTIHDTSVNGFSPYDANALAKAAGGTPFKRPENGQFRPGSNFSEFIFDTTGDTNALTEAGSDFGGFGAIFRLRGASGNSGSFSLVFRGDAAHTGLDNCGFWDANRIVFVEDAGDGLHSQRNALDSAYLFDLNTDYGNPANQPLRILAEGRDTSATLDSQFGGLPGFQNEGDNEITGWHQSDGDPTVFGLLGAKIPSPFRNGWRLFFTQQHGDNFTWEVLPAPDGDND